MAERIGASLSLLGCFAEFYEAVATLKLAIAEGRLSALLTLGDEPPPTAPGELAARTSARLFGVLREQQNDVARSATAAQIEAHREAAYIMAALADEVFILELKWAGHDAWMEVLLEQKLTGTRDAGTRFFDMADRLLAQNSGDAIRAELAAVLVLALRLGFKGKYRGHMGESELHHLRVRLHRLSTQANAADPGGPICPQALEHLLPDGVPLRLAPLTRWYMGAAVLLLLYLFVSSALWSIAIDPFRQAVGAG